MSIFFCFSTELKLPVRSRCRSGNSTSWRETRRLESLALLDASRTRIFLSVSNFEKSCISLPRFVCSLEGLCARSNAYSRKFNKINYFIFFSGAAKGATQQPQVPEVLHLWKVQRGSQFSQHYEFIYSRSPCFSLVSKYNYRKTSGTCG